ncbi:MAG: hypothetical protein HY202_05045 [Nitrospirae bacterium]|nr:hypothetical protein [Nitrospirota bacterium]
MAKPIASLKWRNLFIISSFWILCLASPVFSEEPLMINQILIHLKNPQVIYAAGRPQGILKSADRGKSWFPARKGLKNTSVYHLVISPTNPQILYLGTFGGGIYKSADGGDSWTEINNGLGNTNIHALAIDPAKPDQLVAATSTGEVFLTLNGGSIWTPFSQGLPFLEGEVLETLLFDTGHSSLLYMGQDNLYSRSTAESTGVWEALGPSLKNERITHLAFDPIHKILYAGTKNDGLFSSQDKGKTWKPSSDLFKKQWIQRVILDRSQPPRLYVSVLLKGLFKSADQGKTWKKLDQGLPLNDDILSLAIDSENPDRLYAGTHNNGIFVSTDSGNSWTAPEVKQEPVQSIILSLASAGEPGVKNQIPGPSPVPPPAFSKCTTCHGWTDPLLSQKKTYWRVPPNRREWSSTVRRMGPGAGLSAGEEKEIIDFLNGYHTDSSQK